MMPKLAKYMLGLRAQAHTIIPLKPANQSSDILQHSQNRANRTQMIEILKYDNPDHKIKLKIRQIQVLGESTGQINNTGYEWYIGS